MASVSDDKLDDCWEDLKPKGDDTPRPVTMFGELPPAMVQAGQFCDLPPIHVLHSDLERIDEGERFKSQCPKCGRGLLLVHRHPETFQLIRHDRCVLCGQAFHYLDDTIAGEPLQD